MEGGGRVGGWVGGGGWRVVCGGWWGGGGGGVGIYVVWRKKINFPHPTGVDKSIVSVSASRSKSTVLPVSMPVRSKHVLIKIFPIGQTRSPTAFKSLVYLPNHTSDLRALQAKCKGSATLGCSKHEGSLLCYNCKCT